MTWTCVECGLPDTYDGHGDGIGSCMCSRCERCGQCEPCAYQLGLHSCGEYDDEDEDDGWSDDEDWLTQDTARHIRGDDDGTAESSRWHPVHTITVGEFL